MMHKSARHCNCCTFCRVPTVGVVPDLAPQGTAASEDEELFEVYGLTVAVVPTHKPRIRTDHAPIVYFKCSFRSPSHNPLPIKCSCIAWKP